MKGYEAEIHKLIDQLDSEINLISNRCTNLSLGDYDLNGLYSEVFIIYTKAKDLMKLIRDIQSVITPSSLEPVDMTNAFTQDS